MIWRCRDILLKIGKLYFLAPLVILFCLANWAAAGGFLAAIGDIPLPPGYQELGERNLTFDKPSGRIVTAFAQGPGPVDLARRFYGATLPQLGWRMLTGERYARDGEILRLRFKTQDGSVIIEFALAPAS